MKKKRINFRVTEDEKQDIEGKAKKAGLNVSQYAARATLEKDIIVMTGFDDVSYQLGKIGGNLNQITKKCNEGIVTCFSLNETKSELARIYQYLVGMKRNSRRNTK